ncbi:cyclase family protein [Pseudovibrio exalbescens]|uniref:cyclase family protein n=1 Tax=Pseudovibrio exalbescens TaxID=197461 RepID=UPI000C99DA56|nr:cyclase family protein [Pseudovibrio exalbescens]
MGKKVLVDLSHPFGADIPLWPYFKKPKIDTLHGIAKSGVLTQQLEIVMHCGTHADSPRHVMDKEFNGERARYTHEMPLDCYYGDAVCLDIRTPEWGLISGADLDDAVSRAGMKPEELEGMIIVLRTGMHLKWGDTKDYFHYATGCGAEAGHWFVKHKVKTVAMDQQALDHPLHTSMGLNGLPMNLTGKSGKPITVEYEEKFGKEAYAYFNRELFIELYGEDKYKELYGEVEEKGECEGTWEPCHKLMLGNGITGYENVGGDLEKLVNKRFKLMGFPIRWFKGDGSMVRLVAEIDEDDLNDVPDRVYPYGDH